MGRSKSAKELADEFVANAEAGNHERNDELVRDSDPRNPIIVDAK